MLRLARDRLETERLILRLPEAADAPRVAELANHREIAERLARMPHPYALQDAQDFIARVISPDNRGWTFAIEAKSEDNVLIGMIGYGVLDPEHGDELGYWLGLDYWGKGYVTEAASAVLTHAFCLSMIDEMHAECQIGNEPSRRVLEKLGFSAMGTGVRTSVALEHEFESSIFKLKCDDWLAMKSTA